MIGSNIIEKIMTEYDIVRQKNEAECQENIKKINAMHPRLAEIDKEIAVCGSENVIKIIKNPKDAAKYHKELEKKLESLENERKEYLNKNGIDLDYKIPKYRCKNCQDRGILKNGERCYCYRQKLINELYNVSNLSELLQKQNFDNFSLDYYSKEIKKGKKKSPYENMKSALAASKKFASLPKEERKNLLFYGEVGQGKTFLSSSIAKELLQKGEEVIYIRAIKLFNSYEDYKFGRLADREFIERIYNCDLLIIDDLGTENINKVSLSFMHDLFDERINRGNSTIINTNLTIKELSETYSKRFTSRLAENYIIYEFYGEDIRVQKLY